LNESVATSESEGTAGGAIDSLICRHGNKL
jgi:hypothetical protein